MTAVLEPVVFIDPVPVAWRWRCSGSRHRHYWSA